MIDTPTELESHCAAEFLLDFDRTGRHNIVAMDAETKALTGRTFEPGDFDVMFRFIEEWNGKRNLYFSVNEPREGAPHDKLAKSDIAFARAVHADIDPAAGTDLEEARAQARETLAQANPSIVVDSGGGIQAFWKLDEKLPLDDFTWVEDTNAAIRERFGGDPSVKNVDRIMRLPFTLNIPSASKIKKHPGRQPRLAEVISTSGPTRSREALLAEFPSVATRRTPKSEQPLVELDTEKAIRLATQYLVDRAPEAVEGAGGDQAAYTVACACRDYGVSEGVALDLMLDHWNEQKASPPWAPEELAEKVSNAYTYASGGYGAKMAEAEMPAVEIDEGAEEGAAGEAEDAGASDHLPMPVDLWANFDPPILSRGLLPKLLKDFSFSQAELMGADPGGLAASALAVCAAAIPDALMLQVNANNGEWTESARIWVALVGDPSAKKSPVMRRAVKPLRKLNSQLVRDYEAKRRAFEALGKDEKETRSEPPQRRLIIEDTTIEAAQDILRDSPEGLLCCQDELSGWFGSMDKYSGAKGSQKDRAFWLSSFNGDSYSVQRVTQGRSSHIPNLSISMLGGIQPDSIRRLAADGVDDGFLQRIFPIVLRRGPLGIDRQEDPSSDAYDALIGKLRSIATYQDGCDIADIDLQTLRFSPEAQEVHRDLMRRHHELMDIEVVNLKLASHIGSSTASSPGCA
ncbi:MAG: DUF3987 domain-containing protein [Mesorhizobium sp.]|nr:DUF3987 domain-containing protein [Mesorhizobium sp.]